MWGRLRRILIALTVILLFPWGVVKLHEHRKLSAWADQYASPTITFGAGVVAALGNAIGTLGSFQINNGSWVDPVAQYNVSAENTTGLGAITTGTATLSLNYNIHLGNGMGVAVVGAGAAGATEITTVLSGGSTSSLGTNAVTLANNASTTVTNASVYAIGSIGATSNLLTVASTVGWQIGQGIDVATVGTSGADLVTTVTGISSTQLALAANSVSAGTDVKINHDDTAGLSASLATQKGVNLATGQYNITSGLSIAYPQWVQCSSAGIGTIPGFSGNVTPLGGTVIWNRGTTDNVVSITSQQVHFLDCVIEQAPDITPTAGYGLVIGSGSSTLLDGGWIERNIVYNTYGLFDVNEGVYGWDISFNSFYGGSFTDVEVTYNNPVPAGDNKIVGNNIINQVTESLPGLTFVAADTNEWIGTKFDSCNPCIALTSSTAFNQRFTGGSMEDMGGVGINITAGKNFQFTGMQFGVDNGHGAFNIVAPADYINITGSIFTNAFTGTPLSATIASNHISYIGNTDTGDINTTLSTVQNQLWVSETGSLATACLSVGYGGEFCGVANLDSLIVGGDTNAMMAAEDSSYNIQAAVSAGSPPSPFSLLSGLGMYSSGSVYWGSSATNLAGGTFDTRLTRSAAGVIEASTTTANNGLGTFKGGYAPVNLDVSPTAPTFTSGACVGSISGTPNGTAAFAISTGTGKCTSAFTLGMPTATTGWLCNAWDPANAGTAEIRETTVSTTAPVFTNYSIGTHPAATNFTASHTIRVTCSAY